MIGRRDIHAQPRTTMLQILERHGVEVAFPPEVEVEVEELERAPGIDDPSLVDLTRVPFVTIDNEDSRDLDQALHIERRASGAGYIVRYALADASHYVKPSSALFKQALRRGISYYLPGLVVPMLPPKLSEGLISLNPAVERRALVFVMTLDAEGRPAGTDIIRARIRSRAQLSYNGVQRFIDEPERSELQGREFVESLRLLREVGQLLITLSKQRDVVQFRRRNVSVVLAGALGEMLFRLVDEERNDVSLWNEQISLLCNMEGASFLARLGTPRPDVQPVYRVHEAPSPESLDHLERVIDTVVRLHGLDSATWRWRRRGAGSKSLADYLDELPVEEPTRRVRQAIERQILVTNQRSMFSSEPGRHFGLGVTPYSRFSSPMREVVGIFTHKEALEKLRVIVQAGAPEEDEEVRERVIASANSARERQRRIDKELVKLAVDDLLSGELEVAVEERPIHVGTIMGITATRLYVRLDHPPAELKVYVSHLEDRFRHRFHFEKDSSELVPAPSSVGPHFKLGDAIALRCLGYEATSDKWVFGPIEAG